VLVECHGLADISDAVKGKKLASGVAYLAQPNILTTKSDSSLSLSDIQQAWNVVAANVVKKAAVEYAALIKSGKNKDEAMELCSQSRFIAAKLHTIGYIFGMFRLAVEDMEEGEERKVFEIVCRLYGLWQIEEQQGYFLKCELTVQDVTPC
jgi:acyl-CoA oxidase